MNENVLPWYQSIYNSSKFGEHVQYNFWNLTDKENFNELTEGYVFIEERLRGRL